MNRDTLKGKWNEIKGQVQSKWGKLTNDDLAVAEGKFDALSGALQKRYGMAKDKAEQELDSFIASVSGKNDPNKINAGTPDQVNFVHTAKDPEIQARPKEFEPKSNKPQPNAR